MDATYRELVINDYEALISFWQETPGIGLSSADVPEQLDRFLRRNAGHSFVAEVNREIVGTVLCGHDGRRGYVYHLAVKPEFRREGIATELMGFVLKGLRNAGIQKCHLFVFGQNELAQAFWESMGWSRRGDIIVFSKIL